MTFQGMSRFPPTHGAQPQNCHLPQPGSRPGPFLVGPSGGGGADDASIIRGGSGDRELHDVEWSCLIYMFVEDVLGSLTTLDMGFMMCYVC